MISCDGSDRDDRSYPATCSPFSSATAWKRRRRKPNLVYCATNPRQTVLDFSTNLGRCFCEQVGVRETGDGEEDGLLPLGEVHDGDGLDVAGGVEVREGGLWKLVTDGDGGGDCGGFRGRESKRLGGMVVLEAKGGGGVLGRERRRLRWVETGGEVERRRGGKEA
ncbi:hypothetical protein TIFTF001_014412 [Ficus carica]|uniref:Uncharacterized protein n=1 Tax=Ficus carica TaxID=3494 RepID=A0AA87ZZG2_FICCA|nr:hypothetical protein TIFTF001_014412 [Ficus carica]